MCVQIAMCNFMQYFLISNLDMIVQQNFNIYSKPITPIVTTLKIVVLYIGRNSSSIDYTTKISSSSS